MRRIAERQLRQVRDVRRVEFLNVVEADVEHFRVAQPPELIFLQHRDFVAVQVDDLHFLQVLEGVGAELRHMPVGQVKLFQLGGQMTVVKLVRVEDLNVMLIELEDLQIAENFEGFFGERCEGGVDDSKLFQRRVDAPKRVLVD